MRNNSDIMEDNTSEDTMMDCGEDEKELDDLMELAANIANSSPSIKDAAERLLTLLGVDEENDDFSSEDEGVEIDLDEIDDDEDGKKNSSLLQQLAVSLAQELKFTQRKNIHSTTRTTIQNNSLFENCDVEKNIQHMNLSQESSFLHHHHHHHNKKNDLYLETKNEGYSSYEFKSFGKTFCESSSKRELLKKNKKSPYSRVNRTDGSQIKMKDNKLLNLESNLNSWNAGWESCASETLRYLVVDEGLSPHHPTVVAMRNHLDLQREQAFLRSGSH
ncbi:uncharacterized protein LOC127284223 [Leptopilina boulardi]|uniref:uncharacterized protein LOC127284223 n=1 Tax=Leptopilina boulardi TaxID=63433 RepID=UPI0021F5CE8E|nr:uncharacterized protein LOC127284223 [Leptopilina boulardi]XP_051165513.1 uncharacterized protein LOC127284223 [Leptopilina boulardi]